MSMPKSGDRSSSRGQIIVIVALAMTALLAAVALVIDGGNAYAQQRRTQNGIDATSEAGATQLARKLVGVPITDADVKTAIDASALANEVTRVESMEYTDHDGNPLGNVGAGLIPPLAQGVKIGGSRDFRTYVGSVIGFSQFTASAEATAITGFADDSGFGGLIPLTFPVLLTECESGGGSTKFWFPDDGISVPPPVNPGDPPYNPPYGTPWPFGPENVVAIPLCSSGPGNVGWIDWNGGGGGVAQLDADIRGADSPPVSLPKTSARAPRRLTSVYRFGASTTAQTVRMPRASSQARTSAAGAATTGRANTVPRLARMTFGL